MCVSETYVLYHSNVIDWIDVMFQVYTSFYVPVLTNNQIIQLNSINPI